MSSKVSWSDVCKPKVEGGLGLRPLKEVNVVMGLKLIWRLTSSQPSLWAKWINTYLIRKGTFWSVKENTCTGSWMWKKILKLRELAKPFHKISVYNGQATSFWYDWWSDHGRLKDILGSRGVIDLGITDSSTVSEVISTHRRRRHRQQALNDIEQEIERLKSYAGNDEDIPLWKHCEGKFKNSFSTKHTWQNIRRIHPSNDWSRCVWFPHNTPKYSFMTWLSLLDRLSTGERMQRWANVDANCVLCSGQVESRGHLFFMCQYSAEIWGSLTKGLLESNFTCEWDSLVLLLSIPSSSTKQFLLRYTFQATIHSIWGERNSRKHGNEPHSHQKLLRFIDRAVRNKLLAIRQEGQDYGDGLQVWFGSREPTSTRPQ